jgi:hypothetical protein
MGRSTLGQAGKHSPTPPMTELGLWRVGRRPFVEVREERNGEGSVVAGRRKNIPLNVNQFDD